MVQMLEYPFDVTQIYRYKRRLKKELEQQLNNPIQIKIAVLGGSTTHNIVEMLNLFLLKNNIKADFYQSEYAQYWQDAIFGNEVLDNFSPDLIYIHTSNRNISEYPDIKFSLNDTKELLDSQYIYCEKMWNALREKFQCPIIQNNFEMLFYRLLGNRDSYDWRGKNHFIEKLNEKLYEYAETNSNFYINDIHYISANYGLEQWHNLNDWYNYKYAMSIEAIPLLALNLASIIKAIYGKNKKFLSIDLDNTLWGGVVGDDGVNAIEIGNETHEGQAYLEFQKYLAELKKQGVVLAVNSKNDMTNALAGLNHPEGVLKPEAFAVIKANWENKNSNIVETAQELQLGIDSCVFLDDNPVEREIVTTSLSGVAVPELMDVGSYIKVIDKNAYFEKVNISSDDIRRSEMYQENALRQKLQHEFADYSEFLKSLQMKAEINTFSDLFLPRIVQLINKSNQFNLTTKRYNMAEIEGMLEQDDYLCIYGRLEDKFGDNGIVAISIGRLEGNTMYVELWLMSCRVLKRNMEYAMMDEFIRLSKAMGATEIVGIYYPTAKNSMVSNFYGEMGFELIQKTDEETRWKLSLAEYDNKNLVIQVNE